MKNARPNVVFIVADDLGYGDLGAFGNTNVYTPYIDRLAEEGMTLTGHYSASPMCAPARASLLTGLYSHRTGAVDVPSNRGLDRIDPDLPTIADLMSSAGYATGMVGKWHNGAHDMRFHPNARGFNEFAGFLNGGMDYRRWALDYNGSTRRSDGRYLTDVFTDEAVDFVMRHRSEPFLLYLAYNAPHAPFQAPAEELERFKDIDGLTETVRIIYAMIARMDAGVGRVLAALSDAGIDENTIVVFTSDNGPYHGGEGQGTCARFNCGLNGSKGSVLEGGIRVPALVRYPECVPAGSGTDDYVHFADWMPTLLTMCGAAAVTPGSVDGANVADLLSGTGGVRDAQASWQWNRYDPVPFSNAAQRDGAWKLYWPTIPASTQKERADQLSYERGLVDPHWLMDVERTPVIRGEMNPAAPLLFDLVTDPGETQDLSAEHPDRTAKMKERWESWFRRADKDRCAAQQRSGLTPVRAAL